MSQPRVAVVTGGGRGIGRGITEALLQDGSQVIVAQRQPLDATLATAPNVTWIKADLSEREAPHAVAQVVEEKYGYLDVLVNNAGIMFERSLAEMSEDEWDRMMAINLRAPVFMAKYLLPYLRKQRGSIINIGSIEGIGANPDHTAYCTSKAGIHGLTRALAVDLGPTGIRCNGIAPGWINSDLSDGYLAEQLDSEKAVDELIKLHPVGRTGEPSDIANLAVFLASDKASFITGQVFVADGGRTIQLPLPH